jgi:thiosulfate/3-mercaptopyruvate sulfurtransferase
MTRAIRLFALIVLLASPARAQTPSPLLVDVGWLAQHVNDRGLVLLHIGSRAEYDAGHIPGARYITEEDVARPHDMARGDLMLELPPLDELRAKVASVGMSTTREALKAQSLGLECVAISCITNCAAGLSNVSWLDGGQKAWTAAGKTLSTDAPVVKAGTLAALKTRPIVVDAEFVKSIPSRANARLVDARAAVFYNGIEPTMNGAKGHIPGAVNIPFSKIADDNMLVDRERVAALFAAAGIKPGDTVVAYCHVGQQGTAVVFGARLLGYPVMLYDGSFQDWAMNKRGPIEK